MNRPTVVEKIDIAKVRYIREHPGLWFCDPCLAILIERDPGLGVHGAVDAVRKTFDETEALCSRCGNLRTVIAFHPAE